MSNPESANGSGIDLIGAGVVGRAILRAHLTAGLSATLIDTDVEALQRAASEDISGYPECRVSAIRQHDANTMAVDFRMGDTSQVALPRVVIESIAERLELKQTFFQQAERHYGDSAVLCSNTSTLRIEAIARGLQRPDRFCGMHFFMPVYNRDAVELIAGGDTSAETITAAQTHVRRLNKQPLVVGDGPGFIVNRLLSPYLNEAMLLLCSGTSAEQIERAALRYGMPMSPLELIDWIGVRTMFDAGRAFWQAFPDRLNPSPLLAGLVKRKRLGRAGQGGCYDYVDQQRSETLSPITVELAQQYSRHPESLSDDEVLHRLAVPMWIEGAMALRDAIITRPSQLNQAMQGGLGYRPEPRWLDFFDQLGSETILQTSQRWSDVSYALRMPQSLQRRLQDQNPSQAIQHP